MNESGASARALQYGRLRFVAAIKTLKTHDDMLFAANRVSSVYFCRRFLGVGAKTGEKMLKNSLQLSLLCQL
jgi:hypothetical protein